MKLKVQLLNENAKIPVKNDACYNLFAANAAYFKSGDTYVINTGVSLEIPPGYCIEIYSLDELSETQGLIVLNAPAIISSGCSEEISVIMHQTGNDKYNWIYIRDCIAKFRLVKLEKYEIDSDCVQ